MIPEFVCALWLAFAAQAPASSAPEREELRSALEAAVDGASAQARRDAANALASRKDVTLDTWIELTRGFGRFTPIEAGTHVERAPLEVLGKTEDTELHVYVPKSLDATHPAPLLLAFHGTGGNGAGMEAMWRKTAEQLGMLVLAPSEAGPNEGYAFSDRERAAAFAALRWMRRRFDVDEQRIFASGVSRGGHLAWDLALRAPDRLAAIAPMIGSPRFNLTHGQNNLRFLENIVTLPIRDLQGSNDDPALLENLHLAFARLETWKARDAKLLEFAELGHSFRFEAVDWKEWLGAARRESVPAHVVRSACEKSEARAFWAEITAFHKDVVEDLRPRIDAKTWNAMDDHARRVWLEGEMEKHTARLELTQDALGAFTANSTLVLGFRLLLTREMFDPTKPVVVIWNGKKIERRVRADARVLLREFVERFDRSFLPVVSVEIP